MKKYYVNGTELESIEEAMAEVMEEIDDYAFEESIHEEYGYYVNVCDCEFDPVDLLREMGYYDDRFSDWKDEIRSDVSDALEDLSAGETETIFGVDVELIDEDEELFEDAGKKISMIREFVSSVPTIYGDNTRTLEAIESLSEIFDTMAERIKGVED